MLTGDMLRRSAERFPGKPAIVAQVPSGRLALEGEALRMVGEGDETCVTVNIVAHEQVVCVGAVAANLEEFHEVVELTVKVAVETVIVTVWFDA